MGKTAIDVACVAHEIKFWQWRGQVSGKAERKMKTLFCAHLQFHHTTNHTARDAGYKRFLQMLPKHHLKR